MSTRTLAALAVMAIAVTACSSTSPDATDKRAATASASAAFAANTEHVPGTLAEYVGARADVHNTTCDRREGRWTAAGNISNPTTAAAHYRIYVSFLDGDTTVGIAETDLPKVARNRTVEWSTSVTARGDALRCVLRVERSSTS